jgi:hypothetical protein
LSFSIKKKKRKKKKIKLIDLRKERKKKLANREEMKFGRTFPVIGQSR